jgi:hypothetical protein
MRLVRRYDHEHLALSDAAFLRDRGVNAQVVNTHVNAVLGVAGLKWFQVHLVVRSEDEREIALDLLSELDAERSIEVEGSGEMEGPDLSRVDAARYPIDCPRCARDLPLKASMTSCPWCGEPVDAAHRLVMMYGPEVFAGEDAEFEEDREGGDGDE